MTSSMSVVISVDRGDSLLATVDSAGAQEGACPEIVIVAKPEPDPRLTEFLKVLATRPAARVVTASAHSPGAQKNAGIGASSGELIAFVDEGDILDPRFCRLAVDQLVSKAGVDVATCWIRQKLADQSDAWAIPNHIDLTTLVLHPRPAPVAVVVRRRFLQLLGYFDERLDTLDVYDFWLRALERNACVDVIEQPLLTQSAQSVVDPRGGNAYSDAMRSVRQRHWKVFDQDPASLLYERERELGGLVVRHQELVSRRDQLVAAQAALDAELHELNMTIERAGRSAVEFGDLRRVDPISRDWGYDRGKPIDRSLH